MRKLLLVLCLPLMLSSALAQDNLWRKTEESAIGKDLFTSRDKPRAYQLFQLDALQLQSRLQLAPHARQTDPGQSNFILSIPNELGQLQQYRVVESPVMDDALAARYPGIRSYAGTGITDASATIRFAVSPLGFQGMVLSSARNTVYIDRVDEATGTYLVFARKDASAPHQPFECLTRDAINPIPANGQAMRGADDGRLRTYRIAIACTGEYSAFWLNGTETTDAQRKAKVIASLNNALTRLNGIYERDFGVRCILIANNDAIVYLNAATDPWGSELNSTTQTTIDNVIGNANYDIGHLVHRAANNGNAGCIGCVCRTGQKGSAFTSYIDLASDFFVVDYLTHEVGHQFGGNHTFSFQTEGTGANMEPGSGSTIMGYAGITGATTDVQPHSDDYFHAKSIEQITDYIKSAVGGACAVSTLTGNNTPTANAGADFVIPRSTPFQLTGSGTDADAGDVLTYTWEQYDNFGTGSATVPSATSTSGPNFRSRPYSTNPSRSFPILASVLDGTNTNRWEVLPSVARTLNFRLIVRDNRPTGGNNRSDDMIVTVNGTAGPFAVTAPNTATTLQAGSTTAITWSVNSTNLAPVNCANVKISLSTDGGNSFPIVLAASTPNDGSENIVVPNNLSGTCRVKVEAVGNIFYDISNTNFTISNVAPACGTPGGLSATAITSSGATVSWTAVSGANNYDVDFKLASATTWTNAATATTATSVNLSGLAASSAYDWRVRANCSSGAGSYAQGSFTTLAVSAGCITAFEPNETQAAAATIATNTTVSAGINTTTDRDYFRFTTTGNNNLSITLQNLPGDYDLILYNSAGTQIGSSTAGGTANETINISNAAAGTYFIQVFGYNGANSTTVCYNLRAGVTPVSSGCASALDNSSNGTTAGAAVIPFNTNVTGLISPTGDIDHYRFVITTGGTITLTLGTLPADFDLRLLNSAGTQLAISQLGGTSSETINFTATPGTYFAQVFGYNGANSATVCYTLRVALGTATRPGDDWVNMGEKMKMSLYPNPVRGIMNLNISGLKGMATAEIFDINGKRIMNRLVNAGNTGFNMSALPAGVYMMKLTSAEGRLLRQEKFVKE